MISAQFRIRLPPETWVSDLSREFPDATFKLLSGYRSGERAVELGEILSDDPSLCADALRSHPSIVAYDQLEAASNRILGKYETTDTALYEFAATPSLPIEFPVVAENGWFEFDLTGTQAELDEFGEMLDALDAPYELLSLVSTTEGESLLTDRQREVIEAAVRAGYYEVPRECTLAELAASLDIDKATASTILRRGEASLVKWFVAGPETKGRHLP